MDLQIWLGLGILTASIVKFADFIAECYKQWNTGSKNPPRSICYISFGLCILGIWLIGLIDVSALLVVGVGGIGVLTCVAGRIFRYQGSIKRLGNLNLIQENHWLFKYLVRTLLSILILFIAMIVWGDLFVAKLSSATTLTEIQTWRLLGTALVLMVAVGTIKAVRGHLGIASIATGAIILGLVVLTIYPMWAVVLAAVMFIAGLIAERSPAI